MTDGSQALARREVEVATLRGVLLISTPNSNPNRNPNPNPDADPNPNPNPDPNPNPNPSPTLTRDAPHCGRRRCCAG